MLILDHVGKTYPNGVHALGGVSVDVELGEIVAVIGGSGCGKSTLLRAIGGLDPASEGSVVLDGERITAQHEKIGIIFQEPRLLPWLKVAGNVGFGLGDRPKSERAQRVAAALNRVGLADKAAMWPRDRRPGATRRHRAGLGAAAGGAAARRAVLSARRFYARRLAGASARSVGRRQAHLDPGDS